MNSSSPSVFYGQVLPDYADVSYIMVLKAAVICMWQVWNKFFVRVEGLFFPSLAKYIQKTYMYINPHMQ